MSGEAKEDTTKLEGGIKRQLPPVDEDPKEKKKRAKVEDIEDDEDSKSKHSSASDGISSITASGSNIPEQEGSGGSTGKGEDGLTPEERQRQQSFRDYANNINKGRRRRPVKHDWSVQLVRRPDGKFKCPDNSLSCGRLYSSETAFKRHMLRHFQSQFCPHQWCKHSELSFRSRSELQQHINARHKLSAKLFPLWYLVNFRLDNVMRILSNVDAPGVIEVCLQNSIAASLKHFPSCSHLYELETYLRKVWDDVASKSGSLRQYSFEYSVFEKLARAHLAHTSLDEIYNNLDKFRSHADFTTWTEKLKTLLVKPRLPKVNVVTVLEPPHVRAEIIKLLGPRGVPPVDLGIPHPFVDSKHTRFPRHEATQQQQQQQQQQQAIPKTNGHPPLHGGMIRPNAMGMMAHEAFQDTQRNALQDHTRQGTPSSSAGFVQLGDHYSRAGMPMLMHAPGYPFGWNMAAAHSGLGLYPGLPAAAGEQQRAMAGTSAFRPESGDQQQQHATAQQMAANGSVGVQPGGVAAQYVAHPAAFQPPAMTQMPGPYGGYYLHGMHPGMANGGALPISQQQRQAGVSGDCQQGFQQVPPPQYTAALPGGAASGAPPPGFAMAPMWAFIPSSHQQAQQQQQQQQQQQGGEQGFKKMDQRDTGKSQ